MADRHDKPGERREAPDDQVFRAPTEAISPVGFFPKLTCTRGDRPGQEILISKPEMTVGRDINADVKIRDTAVSKQHAVLLLNDREVYIKDLESANGTFVNGQRVLARRETRLNVGDVIDIGKNQYKFDSVVTDEKDFEVRTEVIPGRTVGRLRVIRGDIPFSDFDVRNGAVIGRHERCAISIPVSYISEEHAKFTFSDGQAFLTDLDSSNGTFVNDRQLKAGEENALSSNDRIRVGEIEFQFESLEKRTAFDAGTLFDVRKSYGKLRSAGDATGGQEYDVRPGLSIGRGESNDVVVASRLASDKHARFEIVDGRPYLVDLGSVNGTSVNGRTVKRKRIYGGDRIEIGEATFEYAGKRSPWKTTVPAVIGAVALVAVAAGGFLWYKASNRDKLAATRFAIAGKLMADKSYLKAEAELRQVLEIKPSHREATRLLEECVKLNKIDGLLTKASELLAQGAFEDARKRCDDILYGLDPENARAWELKQQVMKAESEKVESDTLIRDVEKNYVEQKFAETILLADYLLGRDLDPSYKERAAAIRERAKQGLEAQRREAERNRKVRIANLENAIRAEYEQGLFALALEDIKRLLDIDPGNRVALQYAALIDRSGGRGLHAEADRIHRKNAG